MSGLSSMFFVLAPFALFCSEDGNGLLLCPVFIALGFLLKHIENKKSNATQLVVKVDSRKFWEWHYDKRVSSTLSNKESLGDLSIAIKDDEARTWATSMCRYHNAWIPPEEEQERMARERGFITKKMMKERAEQWRRSL